MNITSNTSNKKIAIKETIQDLIETESNPFVKITLKDIFINFIRDKENIEIPKSLTLLSRLKSDIEILEKNISEWKVSSQEEFKSKLLHSFDYLANLDVIDKNKLKKVDLFYNKKEKNSLAKLLQEKREDIINLNYNSNIFYFNLNFRIDYYQFIKTLYEKLKDTFYNKDLKSLLQHQIKKHKNYELNKTLNVLTYILNHDDINSAKFKKKIKLLIKMVLIISISISL